MSNRTVPFTTTVEEMDNLIFRVLGNTFTTMYPNDGRMAIKSAMHACDKIVEEIEVLVAKQAKSAQARAAAQARYAQATPPQATQGPATPENGAAAPQPSLHALARAVHPAAKPPRVRRTKAQIAAGVPLAAVAAQAPMQPAPQPVPMGQVFAEPFMPQIAPQPPVAQPEPPVVTDFAALAQQAASQGVPQFAPPGASPNPAFVPPAPTFG
jgi:hypothetical protein